MKIFRSLTLTAITAMVFAVSIMTSCTKTEIADRKADLLALTSDDAPVTLVFSPASVLKSAGAEVDGDKIVLSKQLERLFSKDKDIKQIADMLASANGVNYNCAVVSGGTEFGCVLFALSDPDKFKSWVKDNGMDVATDSGYTVCYTDGKLQPGIVIDNDIAWVIGTCPDTKGAIKIVESNKERATNNRLAQWKIDCLVKNDINILVNLDKYSEMVSGILAMTMPNLNLPSYYSETCKYSVAGINFDGPSIRFYGEAFDAEGKSTTMLPEGSFEPIPSKALNLVKGSQIVFGFAMPDAFKESLGYFSSQNMSMLGSEDSDYQKTVTNALSILKSMVFGLSVDETASIATFKPTDLSATLAVAYDKTKAEGLAKDWIALAEDSNVKATISNGWKAWKEDSTFIMAPSPLYPDFKLYFTGRDNLALVSTSADISSAKLNDNSSLDNLICYSSVDIKKSHPALTLVNCPFGVEIRFTSTNEKSEGYITLTDCDTPIIETLLNFISRF